MRSLCLLCLTVVPLFAEEKLPNGALRRLGTEAFRTNDPIYSTALSDDGKLVAAGTVARGTHPYVDVFDIRTGERLWHLKAYGHVVRDVSFSPDGKFLVAANGDGALTMYDLGTGHERWRVKEAGSDCALILPDGKTVATERGSTVLLLDLKTGALQKELKHHTKRVHCMAVSDKGDQIALGSQDGEVSVWDVAKGERKHTFPVPNYALGLAFDATGTRLAAACFHSDHLVFDLPNNKELWHAKPIGPLAGDVAGGPLTFSPDGQKLFGLRARGGIYDATTGAVLGEKKYPSHHRGAVSRDRTIFAPVDSDQCVRLINLKNNEPLHKPESHIHAPTGIVFAEGGQSIFTAAKDGLWRWDAEGKGTKVYAFGGNPLSVSPDGTKIVMLGNELMVWDIAAKKLVHRVAVNRLASLMIDSVAPPVHGLHCTKDGIFVSKSGTDYGVARHGYSAKDKVLTMQRQKHDSPLALGGLTPVGFAVAPDGQQVLMAEVGIQGVPKALWWDFSTGKEVRTWILGEAPKPFHGRIGSTEIPLARDTLATPAVPRLFLPNGSAYIAESEAGLLLMRADDGERIRVLCSRDDLAASVSISGGGFVSDRTPLALSPDGRLLVTGQDKDIHVIETATGVRRRSYFAKGVQSLAWKPDGLQFAVTDTGCAPLVYDPYATPVKSKAPTRAEAVELLESTASADVIQAMHHLRQAPAMVLELAQAVKPADGGNVEQIRGWLRDLDADRFAVREAAQKALANLDADWLTEVDAHLKIGKLSAEALQRTEKARTVLRAQSLTAEQRREARLLELLERLNTPEARREVERLVGGAANRWLTRTANETLARMKK